MALKSFLLHLLYSQEAASRATHQTTRNAHGRTPHRNLRRRATAGPLLFGNYFPNHWAERTGALGDSEKVYKPLKGEYLALLIRWSGAAREGLTRLQQAGDVDGRIAAEIDNGRDITYYWSRTLPVGTGYDCPLPGWKDKEYHVVVRSGLEGLGAWHDEQRNLYEDYLAYMGEPPGRIVRVWLIANSVFQRRRGRCCYQGIRLRDAWGVVEVC